MDSKTPSSKAELDSFLRQLPDVTVALPVELTNRNDGQGHSWKRTASERKRLKTRLAGHRRQPFDTPVRIRVTRILGPKQRLWDADSVLRGNAKQLLDTLVTLGWFHDDGPKWITQAVGDQDPNNRHLGPMTLIEIWKAESVGGVKRKRSAK